MQVQIKHISLSYFLVLILLKAMAAPLVVLHFQWNQPYIAQYLCVNRNNANAGCKGSCQLKKNLKTTTETPDQQGQKTISLNGSIDFFEITQEQNFALTPANNVVTTGTVTSLWLDGFGTDIFHPPSA